MVQADINNEPISIVLAGGESTTVPSGEVWKVTLKQDSPNNAGINRKDVADGRPFETVLVGGDRVQSNGDDYRGVHIGGFVVN
ncbi:hypothetical protein [Halorussus salinus]|uniref:hypothetical protein n=1 Tax=Halorussus salinus TaxID=1364935 RepID=UPI00138F4DC7|nr:hypothetical protein [Halorussus salinus]